MLAGFFIYVLNVVQRAVLNMVVHTKRDIKSDILNDLHINILHDLVL